MSSTAARILSHASKLSSVVGWLLPSTSSKKRLDPITTLFQTALLAYYPTGTKIGVTEADGVVFYVSGFAQGTARSIYGASNDDWKHILPCLNLIPTHSANFNEEEYNPYVNLRHVFEKAMLALYKTLRLYKTSSEAEAEALIVGAISNTLKASLRFYETKSKPTLRGSGGGGGSDTSSSDFFQREALLVPMAAPLDPIDVTPMRDLLGLDRSRSTSRDDEFALIEAAPLLTKEEVLALGLSEEAACAVMILDSREKQDEYIHIYQESHSKLEDEEVTSEAPSKSKSKHKKGGKKAAVTTSAVEERPVISADEVGAMGLELEEMELKILLSITTREAQEAYLASLKTDDEVSVTSAVARARLKTDEASRITSAKTWDRREIAHILSDFLELSRLEKVKRTSATSAADEALYDSLRDSLRVKLQGYAYSYHISLGGR
ncbi:MAG: hypothetical protein GWP59_01895 [Chlamydiales bacterium]|nr:hypothetical protein [Chlamydiales bacterium]NCF70431.1 hypothetical protein [Chlamydiales bacterium]